jgi:uncharacterized protein YhbP (UPF0306 family)
VRESALAYLAAHNVMTIATSEPWAAAVFYVNDGFTLHFLSAATTRHCTRLATDHRVAVTVHEDYDDWRAIKGVQLEGTVARVSSEALGRVKALYAEKFPFVGAGAAPAIVRALARIDWYTVTASGLWFIDNARGFGHRDYIALAASDGGSS